jgi:DNA-binding response OmpR family regulator
MSKPRALVVEDDVDLATTFSEALNQAGYESEIANTGGVAMERLNVSVPEVVVLDLHLPQVPGTEILRYIRESEKLSKTRVIITTADDTLIATMQGKADAVLLKPVGFHRLQSLVKSFKA